MIALQMITRTLSTQVEGALHRRNHLEIGIHTIGALSKKSFSTSHQPSNGKGTVGFFGWLKAVVTTNKVITGTLSLFVLGNAISLSLDMGKRPTNQVMIGSHKGIQVGTVNGNVNFIGKN